LRTVQEKSESDESALDGLIAGHPAALDSYRVRRQRKADDCDAARRAGHTPIGDQSIGGVVCAQKITEGRALETVEQVVVGQRERISHDESANTMRVGSGGSSGVTVWFPCGIRTCGSRIGNTVKQLISA
jgi:hypothetical protein